MGVHKEHGVVILSLHSICVRTSAMAGGNDGSANIRSNDSAKEILFPCRLRKYIIYRHISLKPS